MNKQFNIMNIESAQFSIKLTDKAIQVITKALLNKDRNNKILRISVEGGGCSGFKYGLNFVNIIEDNDIICKINNEIKIIIDINSYCCMDETTIDYVIASHGAGFTFSNPNSMQSCGGCG